MCLKVTAVFLCCSTMTGQTIMAELTGDFWLSRLGSGVTAMDDLDGDGVRELASAGTELLPFGGGWQAFVRIYNGADLGVLYTVTGLGQTPAGVNRLLVNLTDAGDTDGDGVRDLAVAAWETPAAATVAPTPSITGSAFVISGTSLTVTWVTPGLNIGDDFGFALSGAGDVNNDGFQDVIVGCPQYQTLGGTGYFQVYSGLSGALLFGFSGLPGGVGFARAVAGIGDFNGDGTDDVAVSLNGVGPNGAAVAQTQVFGGPAGTLVATLQGLPNTGGSGLAPAGDLNGDGLADLAILEAAVPGPQISVWSGGAAGGTLSYRVTLNAPMLGWNSLSSVSDLDGDGLPDFLFGGGQEIVGLSSNGGQVLFQATMPGVPPLSKTRMADFGDLNGDDVGEFLLGTGEVGPNDEGMIRLVSGANLPTASVTSLGPGFAPTSIVPVLSANASRLNSLLQLVVQAAPPSAAGLLVLAPAPAVPTMVFPALNVYPDLAIFGSWITIPMAADPNGGWALPVALPFNHDLAGTALVLQGWFPAPGGLTSSHLTNGLQIEIGY